MVGNMISLNIITSMFHLQNHNQNDYGLFVRSVSWKTNANKCKYKYLWLWAIGSEHLMKRPTTTPRRMKVKTVPRSKTSRTWNFTSSIIMYIWSFKRDLVFWQGTVSKLWTVVSPNSTATKFLKLIWAPKIMVKLVIPKQLWNFSNCSTKRDGKKEFQSNWIFLKRTNLYILFFSHRKILLRDLSLVFDWVANLNEEDNYSNAFLFNYLFL